MRKGIILAGGAGSRLYPNTLVVSKQLLPVYDKPMVYYPLSTLMLANIKDVLVICTPHDIDRFKMLLGSGESWGMNITYKAQPSPDGIAQAFILAEDFIGDHSSTLILGDNIFYGDRLHVLLEDASSSNIGATVFAYHVNDPERYGVVEVSKDHEVLSIKEKPKHPKSNYALTGLYFYDNLAVEYAKKIKPSKRGELEITDLMQLYLDEEKLNVQMMGRGYAWLDTGTQDSFLEASQFIATLEKRQGLKIACPEEIAYRKGWINKYQLEIMIDPIKSSTYGQYLLTLLSRE